MMKFALLGAAAVLAAALTGPASAQQVIYNPGYCAQYYPNANCQNLGPNNPYTGDYQRRESARQARADSDLNNNGWHDSWNDRRRTQSGFWPAGVAAGAVGAAVGTAGAIATAPFRGDAYAYDYRGDRGWNGQNYSERNGFVCQPGTWIKGEDGRRHLCQ